jgi:hypothetical protein
MRKHRSFVVTVHRWLFYVSVAVVIASALSRIEDASPSDARRIVEDVAPADAGVTDDAPEGVAVAFAACP